MTLPGDWRGAAGRGGAQRPGDVVLSPTRGRDGASRRVASLVVLERLAELEKEFLDLEARLGDPDLIADQARYQLVAKRYRELEPIVERTASCSARRTTSPPPARC